MLTPTSRYIGACFVLWDLEMVGTRLQACHLPKTVRLAVYFGFWRLSYKGLLGDPYTQHPNMLGTILGQAFFTPPPPMEQAALKFPV